VVALREGTSKIVCLKILLKRSQGRAIAKFDRDFVPYWRCCITETSSTYLWLWKLREQSEHDYIPVLQ